MVARGLSHVGPFLGALLLCQAEEVFAQDPGENLPTSSIFRSTTYARLFGRATTLGHGGAIVTTENQLPVVAYVSYWASGIDTVLGRDTASMEVTGWQAVDALARDPQEADLQTAHLTLQMPHPARTVWLTLGRQIKAGGAARFARFDGISAGIQPHQVLSLRAYAGYRVLPRFDQRPGYHHLGAASDVLLTSPEVLEPLNRKEYSVVGGDVRIDAQDVHAALSVHDETDAGSVGRRNLGLDLTAAPFDKLDLGGAVLLDLDALRWSSARAFVDYFATPRLSLSGQYLRAEPALLLSRQSVLSVFSTSNYQELGLEGRYRIFQNLSASASAFAQDYTDSGPGARISAEIRATTEGYGARTFVGGYTRVSTLGGGYHSARAALSQELAQKWTGTVQSFLYLYDVPIANRKTSTTHSITIDYEASDSWEVLWGGSVASSPYASLDASTQVRLSYLIDGRNR